MANPRSAVVWTPVHEDALKGLMHLGLGKQYALDLLEHVKSTQLSDMMNEALRMHSASKKPTVIAGGPAKAVPIRGPTPAPPPRPMAAPAAPIGVPPPAPRPVSTAAPPPQPQPPLQVRPQQQIQPQQEAEAEAARQAAIKRMSSGWASAMPPKAPIQAAAAQLQPTPGKPRIRVRAAGSRIPPAPLGGEGPSEEAAPPTKEAQAPSKGEQTPSKLPRIRSEEELAAISPGTEFVWVPDGHIYRKNE